MTRRPYRVDGEIGRFRFEAYEAVGAKETGEALSVKVLFAPLSGKSWYRTEGFKEVAYVHGSTNESYRKTTALLNRIRHQLEGGTPARTLQDSSQREGEHLLGYLKGRSEQILNDHDVTEQGHPLSLPLTQSSSPVYLPSETVQKALEQCRKPKQVMQHMQANPVPYEDPQQTVNISVDDVGVKRQSEHRPAPVANDATQRKYAYQTVVHVENQVGCYRFNAVGLRLTLSILLAFLLHNNLLQGNVVFFADGQRSLHTALLNTFTWVSSLQLILDWYHLQDKCKKQLSLACKGRRYRNTHLVHVCALLWHGLVDEALIYLDFIDPTHLKDDTALEPLKGYLQRNKPHIPCYCVRKQLGLRNSSNLGEKANDMLVSSRQKHNGMSWSKTGSAALAAITALVFNQEYSQWFRTGTLNFKLVPYPQK